MTALLQVRDLSKRFGGLQALAGVSFEVGEGEIHSLIGPNGAGKTTVLNLVTRIYAPTSGEILFGGEDLARIAPHNVVRAGIARTFQHVELFPRMSVLDNVAAGAMRQSRLGVAESMLGLQSARRSREEAVEIAHGLLERVGLARLARKEAREITGGQARLVGLARALAARPRLLLLDELVAGFNMQETAAAAEIVRSLRDSDGITLLVIEHDMRFVMSISDRITVLNFGRLLASGTREEVQNDPAVIEAYLGTGWNAHA